MIRMYQTENLFVLSQFWFFFWQLTWNYTIFNHNFVSRGLVCCNLAALSAKTGYIMPFVSHNRPIVLDSIYYMRTYMHGR